MKRLGFALLGAAFIALLLVPSAQAHKLTPKKAKEALTPLAAETTPRVAQRLTTQLPGATITKTTVGACAVLRKGHRADCQLIFDVAGGPTEDTDCLLPGRVEFRSKTSKRLKASLPFTALYCIFYVP